MMLWIGQKMQSLFSMSATSLDRLNGRAGVRINRGAEPWDGLLQWTPTVFYVLSVPAIRGQESAPIRASIHTAGSTPPQNTQRLVEAFRCVFSVLPCMQARNSSSVESRGFGGRSMGSWW